MKKSLLSVVLVIFCSSLFGQEWVNKMLDPTVNFYEVQDAFYDHWGDKGYERGKGYKQFKRWEYKMEPRVYPTGERIDSRVYVDAWKKIKKMQNTLEKDNAEWEPVGPSSWNSVGWNPGLGRINAIIEDPNDANTIYVCTPSGGLWKSTDSGDSWTPLTDNLPAIGASGLAIDPNNSDVLYLATGDGDGSDTYSFGVLKSTDGGESWSTTSLIYDLSQSIKCSKILMDPTDTDKLYVATSVGLVVSNNGGNSWYNAVNGSIRDIEFKPGDPSVIYASGTKFYRSTDSGASFNQVSAGLPSASAVNRLAIAVTPANPELVYMIAGDDDDSGFYGFFKSDDSGESFSLQSNTPNILTYSEIGDGDGGQSWYDLAIAASTTDEDVVYTGGINVWKTNDGGANWEIKSHWVYPSGIGYTHADIHELTTYGNKLYCGSDGGIFSSTDAGNSWADHSDGLQISQFYRIAISTTDPNLILTAAQDNGTNLFDDNTYTHLLGGDGNAALIDYTNDQVMYSAYPGGDFQRSTDGGQNFNGFSEGIDESGAWVTPFKLHPTNPNIIFGAFENVWRKSGNSPWEKISDFSISGTLQAMCIAPSDPDIIYVSSYGTLLKTTDGGANWSNVGGLPNNSITSIEIHPENSSEVWLTMSGYNENSKVFHSVNGGESWENLTFNLPNIPANCIAYQQGSDGGIYVGTDAGVFYKDNTYENWAPYNAGLPNVIINQILFQYQTSEVVIGTFGRGVWKNQFFDSSGLIPVAKFSAEKNLICAGDSIEFIDQSLNISDSLLWTFEGGNPEQTTAINPTVTYNSAGNFNAKLWVANPNGSDSLIAENSIHVLSQTGEATPVVEGFENAANLTDLSWFVENPDELNQWQLNTETGYNSSQSVWLNNYSNPSGTEDALSSRTFDLSELDTAIVTMRVAFAKKPQSATETLKVLISTDCGDSWTLKKLMTSLLDFPSAEPTDAPFAPSDSTQWNFVVVDNITPEERTENFRIRLVFRSNGGNNLYVDNINIRDEAVPVTITEPASPFSEVEIYPNPVVRTGARVKIATKFPTNLEVDLYDATGKRISNIFDGRVDSDRKSIPLSVKDLAPGAYMLLLRSDEGSQSELFIVE